MCDLQEALIKCAWSPAGLPFTHTNPPPPPPSVRNWNVHVMLSDKSTLASTSCMHFQKSNHLLRSEVSWCNSNMNHRLTSTSICRLSADLHRSPKETFSEIRVHAGTTGGFRMLTARHLQCRSSSQEIVWSQWKRKWWRESFEKWKRKLPWQTDVLENLSANLSKTLGFNCENASVKLMSEVRKEVFARTRTAAHKPTSAQTMVMEVTPDNRPWTPSLGN